MVQECFIIIFPFKDCRKMVRIEDNICASILLVEVISCYVPLIFNLIMSLCYPYLGGTAERRGSSSSSARATSMARGSTSKALRRPEGARRASDDAPCSERLDAHTWVQSFASANKNVYLSLSFSLSLFRCLSASLTKGNKTKRKKERKAKRNKQANKQTNK